MAEKKNNLLIRAVSSAVLIPIVIGILVYGGWVFGLFVAAMFALSLTEWTKISLKIPDRRLAFLIAGPIYLSISCLQFFFLRFHVADGLDFVVFLLLLIWASDSFAYFYGKTFGGPKMSPTVSPNKTWSGYAGALLGPAVVLTICIHILTPTSLIEYTPPVWTTLLAGAVMGVVGQSGDLLISFMKRKAGVKDSGAIIPGHGGILDRIDALLLVIPVYFLYVHMLLMR
jgi:phosphatidate cytidylyltransferase